MKRDESIYIDDMLEGMEKIKRYTQNMTYNDFVLDEKTQDAVLRNLEVIGEAAKNTPQNIRDKIRNIPWKNIIGLRNITIHQYFGVDLEIIWKIITNDIPKTKKEIKNLKNELKEKP